MQGESKKLKPVLFATATLAVLLIFILGISYYNHDKTHRNSLQLIQSAFTSQSNRLDTYIKRLHLNLNKVANNLIIKAFLHQRNLPQYKNNSNHLENTDIHLLLKNVAGDILSVYDPHAPGDSIYTSITLFNSSDTPVVHWPDSPAQLDQTAIKKAINSRSHSSIHNQALYLYSPAQDSFDIPGYLIGVIPLSSLANLLQPALITPKEHPIRPYQLLVINQHTKINQELPYDKITQKDGYLLAEDLTIASDTTYQYPQKAALFTNNLTTFPLAIINIEEADKVLTIQTPGLHLIVLAILSIIIIVVVLSLLHSALRNQALQENLENQRHSKVKLREKNKEINFIINAAKLGTWVWNAASGTIKINEEWARMLGYAKDEISLNVESWSKRVHPDDWNDVENLLKQNLNGNTESYLADYRMQHKEGHYIWIHDAGQVMTRNQDGSPKEVLGIHMETTVLHNALKEAEKARQEADSVITNLLDSLLVINTQLKIVRISKETSYLLGLPKDKILGQSVTTLFQEQDDRIIKLFRFYELPQYQDQNSIRNIELSLNVVGAPPLPVWINLSVLRDDNNEIIGVVAAAKDISALKRALDEAHSHRLFVENILHIIPGGLLVVDSDINILRKNQTYDQQLKTWSQKYHLSVTELHALIVANIKQKLQQKTPAEFAVLTPEGDLHIALHASETKLKDTFGRVLFIYDVTERHQAEAQRKLLSTVFEQTSEGVLVTTTDGTIQYANQAITIMSGYNADELIGKDTSIFKNDLQESEHYEDIWHTLANQQVWKGSLTNRTKKGDYFEIEATISPVRNEQQDVSHYVALWHDMTKERSLQQQLLQAQKLESIGQLAAGIAHEINTPIQYIQNNLAFFRNTYNSVAPLFRELHQGFNHPETAIETRYQALEQIASTIDFEFLQEEIPDGLEDSLSGIEHVTRIVAAMKEFSHPGGDIKAPADLNKLIDNALIVTRNEWKYCATVDLQLDADLPMLMCDASAWSQILLNLIVNGADAIREKGTEDGMGKLTIVTKGIDKNTVELTLTDTGCGIKDAHKNKIFDPFFTTKEVGKGSGQGLAIVYDIVVNKHGGNVQCESVVNDHTSFIIRVPIA